MKRFGILWVIMACLSAMALADVKVNDHFNDGAIGTNTGGIGTGFNASGIWGGTVTESGTKVTLASPGAGWERAVLASKEGAAIGSAVSRFEFRGVTFAKNTSSWGTGTTDRLYLGVRATNATGEGTPGDGQDNPDTGLWIQMESNSVPTGTGNGSWNGTSTLFYESAGNVRTQLATWTFNTLNWDDNNTATMNFTPVLDFILDISSTDYSLTITGDTIGNLTGSLSNTFAAAGITNELTAGYAASFFQGEAPSVDTLIDQIIVTENAVPLKIGIDQPENGAIHISRNPILSWIVNDPNVTKIDLYFGEDPNLTAGDRKLSNEPATTTTYAPATLAYDTIYYWRVDAYEPNQAPGATDLILTPGEMWTFTTIGLAPDVSAVSPALTAVNAGQASVVLSVTGVNVDIYQWYKVGDPDEELQNTAGVYAGTDTDTLTIYDIQLADEGDYFCRVTNSVYPDPVDSVSGRVMTRRLIIYYPLDDVDGSGVTPDVVSGFDMTLMTTGVDLPSQVAGVPQLGGNALSFNNTNSADPNVWGQYATAGDVDIEAMGNGLTVEAWVKWVGTNGVYQGIVTRKTTWASDQMMWQLEQDMGTAGVSFTRNGSSSTDRVPLTADQWAYVAATVDSATGTIRIYKDGELYSTATGFTYGTGTDSPLKLGCNDLVDGVASGFFNGALDDVRIYNYAISSVQIAQSYADIMDTSVCNREGTADMEFDVNDDCRVDLADFAQFAADWLNDNRIYPQP